MNLSRYISCFVAILFLACSLNTQAQVVINEISYNPPESGNDSLEYIELFNAGNFMADITGWYFAAGVIDTFPNVQLEPGDYFVTAINASAMMNVFGITVHEWLSGALSNGGELIKLMDGGGNPVDSVLYDDADPWPTEPDGDGPSLELKSPELDNNDGANWQFSGGATGVIINGNEVKGTPGAVNSGGGTPGPAVTIDLSNFAFNPSIVVVKVGDIVRWVNNEVIEHNVNGHQDDYPDNPESFLSGPAAEGPWQFDFEFLIPGTYDFQCDPHVGSGMVGKVYVYDPLTYTDFPLSALRLTNSNGQALFNGVPTEVTAVVHGVNFQPTGYSFYIINQNNVGINVFSFDPGVYVVTEGDEVKVSGVIAQFNGLLEILPDAIELLATNQPGPNALLVNGVSEPHESSLVEMFPYSIDSIVTTGVTGYNVFVTNDIGSQVLIRVDSDSGIPIEMIESSNYVRGIGTQFDPSFPFTSGYQILALAFEIVDGIQILEKEKIQMTPNPANSFVKFSSESVLKTIEIYSLDGKKELQHQLQNTHGQISIAGLMNGLHVVKVTTDAGIWTSVLSVAK